MPGDMATCNLVGKDNRIIEMPACLYWISESAPTGKKKKSCYLRKEDFFMTQCYLDLLLQPKIFLPNIIFKHP